MRQRDNSEVLKRLAFAVGQNEPWVKENLNLAARFPELAGDVEMILSLEADNQNFDRANLPLYNLRANRVPDQPIFVGRAIWDGTMRDEIFLPLRSFAVSAGVFGTTNAGKSTLISFLIPQLAKLGVGFWVFDSEKQYRRIIKMEPKKTVVYNPGNFRVNVYEPPPGVSEKDWRAAVQPVFRQQWMREGAVELWEESLEGAGRSARKGGREFPNLNDQLNYLQAVQFKPGTRHFGYHETVSDRVKRMQRLNAYNCDRGYPLDDLLGKICVWEVGDLPDDQRVAFTSLMLQKLSIYSQNRPINRWPHTVCVLDESHLYVSEKLNSKTDITQDALIPMLARMLRKHGVAFWFSSQTLSGMSSSLTAILDNVFLFRLPHGESLSILARSRFFSPEQLEFLASMPDRELVLVSHDCPDGISVRVPDVHLPEVSDAEVEEHMRSILPALAWTPDGSRNGTGTVVELAEDTKSKKGWVSVDKELLRFLENICASPLSGVNERAVALGINVFQMQKRIRDAENAGLIKPPAYVPTGRRGSPKCMLQLSDKGARLLKVDYEKIQLPGKGNDVHRFLQNAIATRLREKGAVCLVEHTLTAAEGAAKAVDIAVLVREGHWKAVEIELEPSSSHVRENLEKDAMVAQEIIFVAKNGRALRELQETVYKVASVDLLKRVRFQTVREILEDG